MSEPQIHHIVIAQEPGGPDVLACVERPRPVPGPGEVLIRNTACGVNRPDQIERLGFYPAPPGAPEGLGLEVSGHVAELGEGVTGLDVGEAVVALVAGGGYSEFVVAPEGSVLPAPEGLDLVDAAGLPETVFTVWANVFEIGALSPGRNLSGSRWDKRDRHDGDPDGQGPWRPRNRDRRHAGEGRAVPQAGGGHRDQLPRGGFRSRRHRIRGR